MPLLGRVCKGLWPQGPPLSLFMRNNCTEIEFVPQVLSTIVTGLALAILLVAKGVGAAGVALKLYRTSR